MIYLLYIYRPPLDLLSFPTRRSSDLGALDPVDADPQRTLGIGHGVGREGDIIGAAERPAVGRQAEELAGIGRDRKSTRLNSSHTVISYAVFCLNKKHVGHRSTVYR